MGGEWDGGIFEVATSVGLQAREKPHVGASLGLVSGAQGLQAGLPGDHRVSQAILDILALEMAAGRGQVPPDPSVRAIEMLDRGECASSFLDALCGDVRSLLGNDLFPGGTGMWSRCDKRLKAVLEFAAQAQVTWRDASVLGTLYHTLVTPSSRKPSGVFYSPEPLVRHLVGSTLGKSLRRMEWRIGPNGVPAGRLRVVDPSMGGGAFLLEALEVARCLCPLEGEPETCLEGPCPYPPGFLLKSLYGVDIDPMARDIAAFSLAVTAGGDFARLRPILLNNLRVGNALISEDLPRMIAESYRDDLAHMVRERVMGNVPPRPAWAVEMAKRVEGGFPRAPDWSQSPRAFLWEVEFPEVFFDDRGKRLSQAGFSCVFGNPPWSRLRELPSQTERAAMSSFFSRRFKCQRGNHNLYKLFLELALEILAPGGRLGFIIPDAFLGEESSRSLRRHLFDSVSVDGVLRVPKRKVREVFEAAPLVEAALVWGVAGNGEEPACYVGEWGGEGIRVPLQSLRSLSGPSMVLPRMVNPGKELRVLERFSGYPTLGDFLGEGVTGEGSFHETQHSTFFSKDPRDPQLVRRMRVHRYFLDLSSGHHWARPMFLRQEAFLRQRPDALKEPPLLVCREVLQVGEARRLQFALLEEPLVIGNSVRYLRPNGIGPFLLLALLNSSLSEWYFRAFSHTYHVKGYEVLRLPALQPGSGVEVHLSRGARYLLSVMGGDTPVDRALDRLVYSAFSLGQGEIDVIEASLGNVGLPSLDEAREIMHALGVSP